MEAGRLRQARVQAVRQIDQRVCRRHDDPAEVVTGLRARARSIAELGRHVAVVVAEHPEDGDRQLREPRTRVEAPTARPRAPARASPPGARSAAIGLCRRASPRRRSRPTVAVGPTSGTAHRTAGSRAAAIGDDPARLAVAEQPDALRVDAAASRGSAPPPARRARAPRSSRGRRASPGYVTERLADAALVVGEHGDAEQLAVRREDLELRRACARRSRAPSPPPETARAGRQLSVAASIADANLSLAQA